MNEDTNIHLLISIPANILMMHVLKISLLFMNLTKSYVEFSLSIYVV